MPEGVRELAGPVRRVDVDEDGADARGRELQQRPLDAGRRPDAHAIALLDADGEEPARDGIHLGVELPVGEPDALVPGDERVSVGLSSRDLRERDTDRVAQERASRPSRVIRSRQAWHALPLPTPCGASAAYVAHPRVAECQVGNWTTFPRRDVGEENP